jgi:hypothetical protein
VVTVRNLRTGQTGTTPALGGGMAVGPLSPAVAIVAGDSYTVRAAGTVYKNPADQMIRSTFGIGGPLFPFTTSGSPDRAELFALPHPWYSVAINGGTGPGGGAGPGAGSPAPGGDSSSSSTPGGDAVGVGRYAALVKGTRGLLGYWRFGEPGGSRVAAAAAGGPNGTYGRGARLGRAGLVEGDGDAALVNTRSSRSSRVSLGAGFNFARTGHFSLEAWVAPSALDGRSRRIFDRFFSRHGRPHEYYLMASNRRVSFARVRGSRYETATRTDPLKVGRRYHLVATYDGRTMRLYVNGELAADGRSRLRLAKGAAALTVGAKSGGGYNFSGTIDDVAVYGTAVSAATVRAHYRAGIGS